MTGLLLVLVLVGLTSVSLLGDLCRRDLERSSAMAEAALRRALEDPGTAAQEVSGPGVD